MAPADDAAPPAVAEEEMDEASRISYLRQRGVEIEFPEDRVAASKAKAEAKDAASAGSAAPAAKVETFSFTYVPADVNEPVKVLTAEVGTCDVLKDLLAPTFASDENMDADTVSRETAGRLKNMMISANAGGGHIKAPSAEEVQRQAAGGVTEAYPLSRYPSSGEGQCVRMYIDEVGALRGRPRNKRAEDLATGAGLTGLSIHGDAYIGRCRRSHAAGERNMDFGREELSASSAWAQEARAEHTRQAVEEGHGSDEHLAKGDEGAFAWTQTDVDLEVRLRSAVPEGSNAKKRIGVSYGKGDKVIVKVDGNNVLELAPLFAKVVPDDCSWSIDKDDIVLTLTKAEERAWTELLLPGGAK